MLRRVRVDVLDLPAFTPPYDHALCDALGRRGLDVELVTSPFRHGSPPTPTTYRRHLGFHRLARGAPGSPAARATRLAGLPFELLAYRLRAREADVTHVQWLTVPLLDAPVVHARGRPLVVTAHDVAPRWSRAGERRGWAALYARADAVVVHSANGRARLAREFAVEPERVHVIPHGAFAHLTRPPVERPLSPELAEVTRPVVLLFGRVEPYKGLDVLLEAWRGVPDAELWIVGSSRTPLDDLVRTAPPRVRWVTRFVADAELPALFRRADLVVLPYREIDQSGVLFTALAFGRPLLLTAVGGFPEVAAEGAAALVPPEDPGALRAALRALLDDPAERARLAANARTAADGRYSWARVAEATEALYRTVLR